MKVIIKTAIVLIAVAALGGCVYGPGYGYVRGDGYYGDAYYGNAYSYPYYSDGYYGYYPGYYGYGPSFGLGLYYGGYGYGRHGRGGYYNHGHGNWSGHGNWGGHAGHAPPHSSGHGGSQANMLDRVLGIDAIGTKPDRARVTIARVRAGSPHRSG